MRKLIFKKVLMASVNKAILIGQITEAVKVRTLSDGSTVCNLTLATADAWVDKATNQKRQRVERHRVVLYRQLADIAARYLATGSEVYVEGRIRTRRYQDADGRTRYTTEIEANAMTMLGAKVDAAAQRDPATGSAAMQRERDPWEDAPE
jgi:single-strand DNA-binding protein